MGFLTRGGQFGSVFPESMQIPDLQEWTSSLQGDSKDRVESLQKTFRRLGLKTEIQTFYQVPNLFLLWLPSALLAIAAALFLLHFKVPLGGLLALLSYLAFRSNLHGSFYVEPVLPKRKGYNLKASLKAENPSAKEIVFLTSHDSPPRSKLPLWNPFHPRAFHLFYSAHWITFICAILTYALPSWLWPYGASGAAAYILLVLLSIGPPRAKEVDRSGLWTLSKLASHFAENRPKDFNIDILIVEGGGNKGMIEALKLLPSSGERLWIDIEPLSGDLKLILNQGIPRPIRTLNGFSEQLEKTLQSFPGIGIGKYCSVPLPSYPLVERSFPTFAVGGSDLIDGKIFAKRWNPNVSTLEKNSERAFQLLKRFVEE